MPKLGCPCGFVHDLSSIPDQGWIVIRDADYERVIEAENRHFEIAGSHISPDDHPRVAEWDKASRVIVEATGRLYECPECERVMWQREGASQYQVYRLDAVV